jgi:hypothetical protein
MLDRRAAAAEQYARPVPDDGLQRLVRHERINEGAVERFGDSPQRRGDSGADAPVRG